MKKLKQYISVLLILCIVVIGTPANAAESTTITKNEALNLALLYYYGNITENELPNIDSYHITPLYDSKDTVLYYCIDFFENEVGKGYVVIASDIEYAICPELSHDGSSIYYEQFEKGNKNIYFNPFEYYYETKETRNREAKHFDAAKNEVPKEKVKGQVLKGEKTKNKKLKKSVEIDGVSAPSGSLTRGNFTDPPTTYLEELGYGNISCKEYSTLESAMETAEAPMVMFDEDNSTILTEYGVPLPGGTILKNTGHCAITAMTTLLMYWRPICCPAYPDSYNSLFERVLLKAQQISGFDPLATSDDENTNEDSSGFPRSDYEEVLDAVNSYYNYNGRTVVAENGYWGFLTNYIKNYDWPLILSFRQSNFVYSCHATVAFAYTIMHCERLANSYDFRFVKLYNGWASTPRYISWDIIQNYGISTRMITFCPYGGS